MKKHHVSFSDIFSASRTKQLPALAPSRPAAPPQRIPGIWHGPCDACSAKSIKGAVMKDIATKALTVLPAGMLALLMSLGTATAAAQGAQGQQAMDVSDQKLEQFVEAVTEVQSVQQEYAAEIQSTQEAAEAQALRQEAQEKMVGAVEDAGLSVTEYNQISQQLQSDPGLSDRLEALQRN
jgi:hypothetical protein